METFLMLVSFLCLLFAIQIQSRPHTAESEPTCGFQSCNPVNNGMINVHLVPHTHDDVGWLKTVDQYYYGDHNEIQNAGVQYILDSVIDQLLKDPMKRFIYVEIAFFARWWREQEDSMRHQVKGLVNEGRLEFILGGWCMNDEASTHYNAIIDQHSLGFEFLRQNFGECGRPRVAWQVDPFGHSREQASLFAQMGFEGLFFGRLDYQDKEYRLNHTLMEMIWKGSPDNLGSQANVFTGVNFNGYGPPKGFNFDQFSKDSPIMDDERLHGYNVEDKVKQFINETVQQSKAFNTNHLMMTMGSDFQYQNAAHWYKNLDKLIKYVNAFEMDGYPKLNLIYSTPSCYIYHVNKAGRTYTTKDDDFFPYASRANTFWTGYFTSRAALKGYVRNTNNFLQVCKQMDALAQLTEFDNSTYNIQILKEAMGVVQHHDAVSGTEKQAVADDYAERLANGVTECQKVVNDAYNKLLPKGSEGPPAQYFCTLMNISRCAFPEQNKQFIATVYNPLGHTVKHWVRIPVVGSSYSVIGPDGQMVASQVVPVDARTKSIPERNGSIAQNDLLFQAKIPAVGFSSYFINMTQASKKHENLVKTYYQPNEDQVISNEHISLTFDGTSGKLKMMENLASQVQVPLSQELLYYVSAAGNNSAPEFQSSGAYVFRPNTSTAHSITAEPKVRNYMVQSELVQEMHQTFSPWATQTVRLYKGAKYAEIEWTVGPIDIRDKKGKEVISRFTTNLENEGVYYTDANGREILRRIRNYRETWHFNQTEPVAGNYYPVNSRIYIQDKAKNIQLTVLTDRSQGGASIHDGSLEVMLHRRMLYDDSFGVGEPLNETGEDGKGLIVRGKEYVFLETIADSAKLHRQKALETYMAPVVSFTTSGVKYQEWSQLFHTTWSGLKAELPPNVHMLTLEQWGGPTITPTPTQPYLIRLEHIYENMEDPDMSKPVEVNLQNLFVPFEIESVEELTLGANLPLSELHRLQWNTTEHTNIKEASDTTLRFRQDLLRFQLSPMLVTLKPMEIRTFQLVLHDGKPPQSAAKKFQMFS